MSGRSATPAPLQLKSHIFRPITGEAWRARTARWRWYPGAIGDIAVQHTGGRAAGWAPVCAVTPSSLIPSQARKSARTAVLTSPASKKSGSIVSDAVLLHSPKTQIAGCPRWVHAFGTSIALPKADTPECPDCASGNLLSAERRHEIGIIAITDTTGRTDTYIAFGIVTPAIATLSATSPTIGHTDSLASTASRLHHRCSHCHGQPRSYAIGRLRRGEPDHWHGCAACRSGWACECRATAGGYCGCR